MTINAVLAWTPDANLLETAIEALLGAHQKMPVDELVVINRQPSPQISSFPAEVITCRLADDAHIQLYCKYGVGRFESGAGHRGGVAYEAEVYRDVLSPQRVTTPLYWGTFVNPANNESWLVIEFLADASRLSKSPEPFHWIVEAARWIGDFHARCEAKLTSNPWPFLHSPDAAYYAGWADRTLNSTGSLHGAVSWLPDLSREFAAGCSLLEREDLTVTHGEYYPKNILIEGRKIRPVDWESAAMAAGEIDLASLTEGGWPPDVVNACVNAYCAARWPEEVPGQFVKRLAMARLYLHFRWLGDDEGKTGRYSHLTRYAEMRALGEFLGFL